MPIADIQATFGYYSGVDEGRGIEMNKPSHEDLLEGKVNTVSLINEPVEPAPLRCA